MGQVTALLQALIELLVLLLAFLCEKSTFHYTSLFIVLILRI